MLRCWFIIYYYFVLELNLSQHENEQLSSWENHNKEVDLLRSKAESAEKMEMKVKNIDSKSVTALQQDSL